MTGVSVRILPAAGAALVPGWAWAQGTQDVDRYFYGPHMWGGGWYGMFFGPLLMIVLLAAAIAVVVLLVRQTTQPPHQPSSGRTALDILKERFARGEIDKQEFEDRRRALGD